jgi:hypothetical protein
MMTATENKIGNASLKRKLAEMRKILERSLEDNYPGDLDRALIEAAYEDYVKLLCGND